MGFLVNSAFAFIGGVVLNFMPCIFPVLSLKAAAIINGSSTSFKLKLNGVTYTFGVLVSMLMLSLTLLTLRNIGYAVDWGLHIQSPIFILILLYVMFTIGLCFCDLFDIHLIFSRSDKANSSFLGGMLLTLGITPCVTPFMAPAISFALIQSSILIFVSIFLFLGLGIALPYFIVSFFPNTLGFLPKSGKWTAALKHFPLFSVSLSVAWLFWVLIRELSTVPVLTGLLSFTFNVWVWIFNNDIKSPARPVISTLFLRLIHYRSSYQVQHKKPFFTRIQKPRR